ncbi:MAG: lipocalin-like domain-containing protein [Gemmatimonadetes bacterium]|nr:lipocalin-like domain-containing protein [Gemmatimonadota bacterium]
MSNASRSLWLGFVVAACALPLAAKAQETGDLVGSWRLDSWTLANGMPRCSEEEGGASGQIIYSSDGHMSAQLGCQDMDIADLSSQAAQGAISRRHFSYYGRYTLDRSAQTVTHHVLGSSSVPFVGSDQVRSFVFEGPNRLTLSPGGAQRLVWLRNR